jgi:hypothetical protein
MHRNVLLITIALLVGVFLGFQLRDYTMPEGAAGHAGMRRPGGDGRIDAGRTDGWRLKGEVGSPPGRAGDDSAPKDLEAVVAELTNTSGANRKFADMEPLIRQWAKMDPKGAYLHYKTFPEGEMKMGAMGVIASELAAKDPQFLATELANMPASRSRRGLIQELAQAWGQADVQRAYAWAQGLTEDPGRHDALAIICAQWAREDPRQAAAKIDGVADRDFKTSLIATVAEQWGAQDPAAAVRWASALPESEKSLAVASLIEAWAHTDPPGAASYVTQLPAGEMQNRSAMAVVASWAAQDPGATAAWVLQFPDDTLRENGIRETVKDWISVNADDALGWTEKLPDGANKDIALASFADNAAYWSPERAAAVVGAIRDPKRREDATENTLRSWVEIDPASAKRWLAASDVPDQLRTRLQALFQN